MQPNQSRAQNRPDRVLSWAVTLTLAISTNHPRANYPLWKQSSWAPQPAEITQTN